MSCWVGTFAQCEGTPADWETLLTHRWHRTHAQKVWSSVLCSYHDMADACKRPHDNQ